MNLYKVSEKEYIFDSCTYDCKGVISKMVKCGYKLSEIELALSELIKTDDNVAHFGIHGMFIYTKKVA